MPQPLYNENHDNNPFLENQDSSSSSKNNSIKPEPHPVLKAEVVEEISFTERWKTNRFWLVRGSYYLLRTVWIIVMAIGGFIAWLISLLFI
ncbi:MAG TPA: hypothetical protein VKX40_07190 [Aequorivita sp.]|nr:hypothetical protein [Aequorivita sp.]